VGAGGGGLFGRHVETWRRVGVMGGVVIRVGEFNYCSTST
jgi:hypothetical protein